MKKEKRLRVQYSHREVSFVKRKYSPVISSMSNGHREEYQHSLFSQVQTNCSVIQDQLESPAQYNAGQQYTKEEQYLKWIESKLISTSGWWLILVYKIKTYLTFPIMKELTNIEHVCNILGYHMKYNLTTQLRIHSLHIFFKLFFS